MELKELQEQLTGLQGELKGYFTKAKEEQEKLGTITSELKEKLEAVQKQADAIDKKIADRMAGPNVEHKDAVEILKENETFQRMQRDKKGHFVVEFTEKEMKAIWNPEKKTTVDGVTVGSQTTGVLPIQRVPGIVEEARRSIVIRGVLSSRPVTGDGRIIDFIRVNAPMSSASPQIETHTKLENAVTFTTAVETIRTIAHTIPATTQILSDWGELLNFLRTSLVHYADRAEQWQLLFGTGSGQDLNGLVTQATAFDTSLLPLTHPGYTYFDIPAWVQAQIAAADEFPPTFIVLNPIDFWNIKMTKDTQGRFIVPPGETNLWGLTPVITNDMTLGTFLVGAGSPVASEIRDKMGITVEIATQHSTHWAENIVDIRAEKRLALVVYRPASYITGSFATSP